MRYITFQNFSNFINSFFRLGKMSIFTFLSQLVFLYILADLITLDLFDLSFESKITQASLGARFLTRALQLYMYKACLRRLMDIMGYENLGFKHYFLVFISLFYPIYVGHYPYLVFALAAIPGVGFNWREGLSLNQKLQFN